MISPPSGVRVWLACGHTDMRKGMDGLAMLAQQVLNEDPFSGALFAFRGKRGGLVGGLIAALTPDSLAPIRNDEPASVACSPSQPLCPTTRQRCS